MATSINPARVDFVTLRLFCAVARRLLMAPRSNGELSPAATLLIRHLSAGSRR
jgi:hypothetical protein